MDGVINCAGIIQPFVKLKDLEYAAIDRVMDVNVRSVYMIGQAASRWMVEKKVKGSIINISSLNAIMLDPVQALYGASKGAVRIFSKAAAIQYAPERIRVNSVHPGFVDTPMTAPGHSNPEVARKRMEATPLGRFGTPYDIAAGCLYLASDDASFLTGVSLDVDGGRNI